jgi:hypothetical protein
MKPTTKIRFNRITNCARDARESNVDATIDFDLRTALPGKGGPKAQPLWLSAADGAFVRKAFLLFERLA